MIFRFNKKYFYSRNIHLIYNFNYSMVLNRKGASPKLMETLIKSVFGICSYRI